MDARTSHLPRSKRGAFIAAFWWATLVVALASCLLLHSWWNPGKAGLPARGRFPDRGALLSYYALAGSAEHYLFYHGLFGFGDRLRHSDMILLGSSHTIFGISAKALSGGLSTSEAPVKVYNMGLVYGEGSVFAFSTLERNKVRDKKVLVDLFTLQAGDHVSAYAAGVERSSRFHAYFQIAKINVVFMKDWFLDRWLPAVGIVGRKFVPHRFLNGYYELREVATGDASYLWKPETGELWPCPAKPNPYPTADYFSQLPNHGVQFPPGSRALAEKGGLRPIFTLVPYSGYELASHAGLEPFLPLSHEGLTYYDEGHVTGAGAALVTSRLLEALRKPPVQALAPPSP